MGSIQTQLKLDNKPKTRKQKMVRDKIHLLRKVGKKLYTGDKIILLQKFEKSKIKKLRVKLLLILILNSLRRILFNTYFNFQLFRANKISVESSSFVHCQYNIFKWLSTKVNFFFFGFSSFSNTMGTRLGTVRYCEGHRVVGRKENLDRLWSAAVLTSSLGHATGDD